MSNAEKTTQIDRFREKTLYMLKLLELSDSPVGFLALLSQLINHVKKSSISAKIYNGLIAMVEKDAQEMRASKQQMIDWLLSKISILEEASIKRRWFSTQIVQRYKAYLKGERPELILAGSFWHGVCMDFMQVCDSVAGYGDAQLFEGFAIIRIKKTLISFDEPPIQVDKPKKISPDSPEGKLLIEKLGHGFINAVIRKNERLDWTGHSTLEIEHEIEYGTIQEIRYPDEHMVVLKEITEKDWEAAMNSSLLQSFHWLNQLAYFGQIKLIPEERLPNDLIRCDELSNRWQLQSFLSSFGVDWNKAPMSRDKLWRLAQRFVLLLEEEILNKTSKKGPRQMKEEAREFIQRILEQELSPLPLRERNRRKYDSMRPIIWKAAQQSGVQGLMEACSETLISSCYAAADRGRIT